jgi:hypothetical protein
MLLQLVDAARGVLDAVLQDLLSDFFLIEDDNLTLIERMPCFKFSSEEARATLPLAT